MAVFKLAYEATKVFQLLQPTHPRLPRCDLLRTTSFIMNEVVR